MKTLFQEPEQLLDHFDASAGITVGQAHGTQKDHSPRFFAAQGLTTAHRVAANEVLLQLDLLRRGNDRVGKAAEPCIHAIDSPVRNCQTATKIIAEIDTNAGIISQENFRTITADGHEHGQIQFLVTDGEIHFTSGIHFDSPTPGTRDQLLKKSSTRSNKSAVSPKVAGMTGNALRNVAP